MSVDVKDGEGDQSLLLVAGSKGSKEDDKAYVKKLSNAVLQVFEKHEIVRLRCVGAASLNNGIKALIIAKVSAIESGDNLVCSPSFTTVKFGNDEKTAIVLEIISIDA